MSIVFTCAERRIENGSLVLVTARNLVTTKRKVWIAKIASVKIVGIGMSAMIDVVVTGHPVESPVAVTAAVTRGIVGIVGVRIGTEIKIGTTAVAIVEMDATMIIE
jgi:hypothetical protein